MFPIKGILFTLVILVHLTNSISCGQHANSTELPITSPEFSFDLEVQEFERLFDQMSIETLKAIDKSLKESSVSRQKRDHHEGTSPPGSDFDRWYNDSLAECHHSLENLIDIKTLEDMLKDVYYIDDPDGINLNGDVTFDSLSISDTLKAPDVISENGFSHGDKIASKFVTISDSLKTIESEVEKLNNLLEGALKTSGNQQVSGNITFTNAYFNCGDVGCDVKSIETSTFHGRNVEQLASKVIRLDQDQILHDTFNFSQMFVDNLQVEIINSIYASDIVTRDGDHTILGEVDFQGSVHVDQLNVTKAVNGFKIDRDTVLTTNDRQIITTPVLFSHDIIVKDLNVDGVLPKIGLDVNTFLANVVQVDFNRSITGKKTFNHVIVENLRVDGDIINGFNLTDLSRHLLTRGDPQFIHGVVTVGELVVNGNIHADYINGNKFEETIVRRNVPTVIRGDKIFTGPVHIKSMEIAGKLNGRQIINRSLGLMLKKGSQVITGNKEFTDLEVKNVTLLHGNVGPLSFELLQNKMDRMINGGKHRILEGPIQLEDITVEGRINGIDLTSLKNDYLKVNQSLVPNVNLNIERAVFKKSLFCDRVNGLKFPDDFITTNTDQFISGNIHVSNNLMVNSNLNLTRVNGYEVNAALWDSLRSSRDQIISGHKTINGNLFVKNLNVTSLNNIKMKDLVLLNGNGIILGNKTFSSINVAGPISVGSISGVKTVNKIAFDELFSNSITKKNYQYISPKVHVKKLVIPMGTNVNVTELDGMNLNNILSSVVYLNSSVSQIIRGRKRFTSHVTFGNLVFNSTFAGYSQEDFTKNYATRSSSEINADISIDSDLFIENDLLVTGRVNELNVDSLYRHSPVSNKPIVINRPMNFRHVRIIEGNVDAPTINGIRFAQEMVTRKSALNLSGDASFIHGLTVNNLTVASINNVTIEPVCNPIQRVFSEPYSLTITGNVIAQQSIQSKKINERAFTRLTTNLIRGIKRFKKLNIKGPIDLKGHLNNFDVEYLHKTYLSRTRNQTIDSEVILRSAIFSGPVSIGGHLSGRNVLTNGFDIAKEAASRLLKTGEQNIEGTFYFPGRVIFRKGLVNPPVITLNETTINLPLDAFLKSRSNQVNSNMVFNNVDTDDMKTDQRSNLHRDLKNLDSITQFYGWKNFTSLEINDLIVDYINGIPVLSLLRSDADANVNATIAVNSHLVVKPNLTVFGKVNGIKLQHLGSKLVLVGGNNTIEAPLTLKFAPTVRSMEVPGPWRRDVSESLQELSIPKKLRSLKVKLFLNSARLNEINKFLQKQKNKPKK